MTARWVWPLLFLSAAFFTAPGLVKIIRDTIALAPLSMDDRRARILGPDYEFSQQLARTSPETDEVALFAADYGGPVDRAIFVNYYLYPRRTKIYVRHMVTTAPRGTVFIPTSGPLRRTFVVDPRPYGEPRTSFIVPFVAAIDLLDPYTTEAVIEATRDTRLTLTFMPARKSKTYMLREGTPLIIGDVVFHEFGTKGVGWLRVSADTPVRAGLWFVNRGGAQSWPLPLVTRTPPLPQTIAGGEKLWLVNLGDTDAAVRVNELDEVLNAGEMRSYDAKPVNAISGHGNVLAFTTQKLPDGNTRFTWPEALQ